MQKKVPQRMCVACRTMQDKRQLLRVVRLPEGELMLDLRGKASGRGAYICRQEECLKKAIKQRQFERTLERPLTEGLVAQMSELIAASPAENPDGGR